MRIENQPEILVVTGRRQQKTLQFGIECPRPLGLIPDGAFLEVRDQIKYNGTAILKPVKRVLKRFNSKYHVHATVAIQQTFTLASFTKRLPIEIEPALRKPLKRNIVVYEATLVNGYTPQAAILEYQI